MNRREYWALAGLFALAFSMPLLIHANQYYLADDWDMHRTVDWLVWDQLRHGHFPWRTKYLCGGAALFANPWVRVISPGVLLHLLFGPVVGQNLEVPLFLTISWAGGFCLGRTLGMGDLGAAVVASAWSASSPMYLHFGAGAPEVLCFAWTPWIVALWWSAIVKTVPVPGRGWSREKQGRAIWGPGLPPIYAAPLAGVLLALCFYDGATYTVVETALFIVILTPLVARWVDRTWTPYLATAVLGAACIIVALPKLIPFLIFAQHHSRATGSYEEWMPGWAYIASLFSRQQTCSRFLPWGDRGQQPLFQTGAYLSLPFVCLALVGLVRDWRRASIWLIPLTVFLVLGMGDKFGSWSPWVLAHYLPVFHWLVVSPKFFIVIPLFVAVMAGYGAQQAVGKRERLIVWAFLLAGLVDCWLVVTPNLWRDAPLGPPLPHAGSFYEVRLANNHDQLRHVQAGIGVLNCYMEMAEPH